MQTQFADTSPLTTPQLAEKLGAMVGLEYVLSHHQENALFVIKARRREDHSKGTHACFAIPRKGVQTLLKMPFT